ncbi:GNAT family N-acetyltransferase [Actinomadura madurae]|uniref:GNAT family N-acetyltransferase n=1 Tax=Actinomadura madurae TaxID=1993 RepID=UPI0020D23A34|nr:GNAT family protein [Actinomadura madurae]MCP9981959.1 GNAT family N-acetyltransferase [Actinomadura madurae]
MSRGPAADAGGGRGGVRPPRPAEHRTARRLGENTGRPSGVPRLPGALRGPDGGEALLVKQADTGAIAGHVTLTGIVRRPYDRAILGFAAFAPSAGQGYMTEGVGLAVLYAFGPLGLHRVEADVQPGNEPSRPARPAPRISPRRLLPRVHQHRRRLARPRTLGHHGRHDRPSPALRPTRPPLGMHGPGPRGTCIPKSAPDDHPHWPGW